MPSLVSRLFPTLPEELESRLPPGMLNWAARYFPIVQVLGPHLSEKVPLLEVGSGWVGIGRFLHAPFVGCELNFADRPRAPMLPVMSSATALPFSDRSFDAVVLSDVLEHIPPNQRALVIGEALRVVRKIAVFGFPSGPKAFEYDLKLASDYDRSRLARPEWLEEHLRYQPFPTEDLFKELRDEWTVTSFGNESVAFHNWVMRREMRPLGAYSFRALLAIAPKTIERLLRYADRRPYYRKIVVVQPRIGEGV